MCKQRALVSLFFFSIFLSALSGFSAEKREQSSHSVSRNIVRNGGFEEGLSYPWGTGKDSQGKPVWWNSSNCRSKALPDTSTRVSGKYSLHVINASARSPQVYGTTAQRVSIRKNQAYRITLWAKGGNLASRGAVSIIVDEEWKTRPVLLPAGTFSWKMLDGVFSLPSDHADIRILSEDKGEAWIDDISVVPIKESLSAAEEPKKQAADPTAWVNKGLQALNAQHYSEAAGAFEEAVRLSPDSAQAHFLEGFSYFFLVRYQDAVNACQQAVLIKHDYPEAYHLMGSAYYSLGNLKKALESYQQAVSYAPAYAEAYKNLGHTYYAMGNYEKASQAYKEAVRIKPDYAEAHYSLGLSYVLLKRTDDAKKEEEILKTLSPDYAAQLEKQILSH